MSVANHRKPPYLHRNWLSAMGNTIRHMDHEDDDPRPAKRRRVTEMSPDSGIGLEPLDGISLTSEGRQAEKAMRIEVLKIVHKDSARIRTNFFSGLPPPQAKDVSEAKARCRITISCERSDVPQPMHVDSQICTVKAYKNPVGPSRMVRIHLPEPFQIPQDKILISREDDDVFGLADCYTAQIQLESAGDPDWPPEFLNSAREDVRSLNERVLPKRQWALCATIENIFQCHRKTVELRIAKRQDQQLPTDFVLDLDIRWASALSAKAMKRLDKDVRPSITCFGEGGPMDLDTTPDISGMNGVDGNANGDHGTNGTNGDQASGDLVDDMDDNAEGELTPGRRRRARPQINYNLKHLSDKAQQKERRKRQKERRKNGAAEIADDSRVTYLFRDQFHLDDFLCFLCAMRLQSFDLLCAHYRLCHDDYSFQFGVNARTVTISRQSSRPSTPLTRKVYQLGPPVKPFDLSAYLDGDDSWVTSRHGSENDKDIGPAKAIVPKAAGPENKLGPRRSRQTDTKKITVPRTKTTLYHPLSKAPLEPGAQIERRAPDERWLLHKHRDTLGDFTDVGAAEKEFLKAWDAHILPAHLSSDVFLPARYAAFVRDRAAWIVARPARAVEFALHMQVLHARGVIAEGDVRAALAALDEARAKGPVPEPEEERPQRRSEKGCARCGKFVENGPAWLVCTDPDCPKPLYHDYCATDSVRPVEDRDNWKCNDCCA